jgi:NitT/TauT family transport system substrate-binding protein
LIETKLDVHRVMVFGSRDWFWSSWQYLNSHFVAAMMRVAVPDLVSNSYFPVVAAVTLGVCKQEGLDASVELVSPLTDCVKALREGSVDFIGASAHAPLLAFPEWNGAKLLCAQSQGTYWILVMRKDLAIARGDLEALKGRRIAAVPFVGAALKRLLIAVGIDPDRERIEIMMPESARQAGVNFGIAAAQALEAQAIDGFFANGMGAELAVVKELGDIVLDIRHGDGPKDAFGYTMPTVVTTERLIGKAPDAAAAMIRAVVRTQNLLKRDIGLATDVGNKLFPPREAGLIARVVARDLALYDASISEAAIASMSRYARDVGLLKGHPRYQDVVATQFCDLWNVPL